MSSETIPLLRHAYMYVCLYAYTKGQNNPKNIMPHLLSGQRYKNSKVDTQSNNSQQTAQLFTVVESKLEVRPAKSQTVTVVYIRGVNA